jgi:hypothetical protein
MAFAATLAVIGLGVTADGADKQRKAAHKSMAAQEKIQSEQRASNAASSARERRQQIREERVRRARVEQAAVNTGVAGSSGELGALSALSTNLNSNIGANLGRIQTADNISIFQQDAANAQDQARSAGNYMQLGQSIFNIGMSFAGGGKKSGPLTDPTAGPHPIDW